MKNHWLLSVITLTSFVLSGQEDISEGACLLQGNTKHGLIKYGEAVKIQNVLRHIRAENSDLSTIRAHATYEMGYLKTIISKQLQERLQQPEQDTALPLSFCKLNNIYSASIDEIITNPDDDTNQDSVIVRLKFRENVDVITARKEYEKLTNDKGSGVIAIEFDSQTRKLSESFCDNIIFSKVKRGNGVDYWEFIFYNSMSSAQMFRYYPKNRKVIRIERNFRNKNSEQARLLDDQGEKANCCCW